MSSRKDTVETYFEGRRRSDHARMLACLTDDVVRGLPGYHHLAGKDAFGGEIENEEVGWLHALSDLRDRMTDRSRSARPRQ